MLLPRDAGSRKTTTKILYKTLTYILLSKIVMLVRHDTLKIRVLTYSKKKSQLPSWLFPQTELRILIREQSNWYFKFTSSALHEIMIH